jgi:cell division protein FtsZ
VIGVGGGGGNAVNHMFREGIHDVSFAICNTDNQALLDSPITNQIQLGVNTTGGLAAGNKPEVAHEAAQESTEELRKLLDDGTKMAFITAGMGGGTGTGAAPVVARVAKDMDILTVGIVTIPFAFEGRKKIVKALKGVEEISKNVDALLVINNERLRDIYHDWTLDNAFDKADDTLATAAKSIAEIITLTGRINLDFADVNTTLKGGGVAIMSSGRASGAKRVDEAIKNALHSPLLNSNDVFSAKRVLVNLSYDREQQPLRVDEMDDLHHFLGKFSDEVDVIWGVAKEDGLGENVKATILATGFSIADVPQIGEHWQEQSRAEKLKQDAKEAAKREEDRINLKKIEDYYGKIVAKSVTTSTRVEPFVLSLDELDDDKMLEALEVIPVFKRDRDFDPRTFRLENEVHETMLNFERR